MTMRERRVVQWSRVFGVYAVVAVICLAMGVIVGPPMHDVMLMVGVMLVVGFVPLVMGIYFARGFRGNV